MPFQTAGLIIIVLLLVCSAERAVCSEERSSCSEERTVEQIELDRLKELDQETCIYTDDMVFCGSAEDRRSDREYCKISEDHFKMFALMHRRPEPYKFECEEGKRVIELRYLYENGKIERSRVRAWLRKAVQFFRNRMTQNKVPRARSPRKWLDYVIFYSTGIRTVKMDTDMFLGVALYSQQYYVEDKHRDTLLDNLFELYIAPEILNNGHSKSFHNRIYRESNGKLRNRTQRVLLENLMGNVLVKVLRMMGASFSIEHDDLVIHAHKDHCTIDAWIRNRTGRPVCAGDNSVGFTNVVMERLPIDDDNADGGCRIILLTLIGMLRSGDHTISIKCREWCSNDNFQHVVDLVNTNNNLAGVAELESHMDLDKMLGRAKRQLRYLEIEFGYDDEPNNRTMGFLKSLNEVEIKATFYRCTESLAKELLTSTKDIRIKSLRLERRFEFLPNLEKEMADTIMCVVDSEKVESLELFNCGMTLEKYIAKGYFKQPKSKLKVLSVAGMGDLSEEKISAELMGEFLSESKLERLYIDIKAKDTLDNLDRLMDRGIITGDGFRYLVFTNDLDFFAYIHPANLPREYMPRIINLKERLKMSGFKHWPAIITDFKPADLESSDCVDAISPYYITRFI